MDPMQKISVHYANLTKAEKITCNVIMENPEVVIENPIAEAAKLYNVSPSSILRLSKKIGYKGYSEFRYALESYQQQEKQSGDQNLLYGRILQTYQTSLNEMNHCIDEEKMIRFVKLLMTKRTISVGVGNSSLPAQQLIYSLYMHNVIGKCIDDNVRLSFLDKAVNETDIIVIFSVSGNVDIYQKEVRNWKKDHVPIVLITTNPESLLIKDVDMTFILPSLPITILSKEIQPRYLENRSIFFIFIDIIMAYYTMLKKV